MKGSQWSKRRCCSLHWRVRSLGSHMCHSDASAAKTASARFLQISQYLRDIMGHVFDVLKWFESGLNWAPNPATSLWPPQGLSRGTCQPGQWESQLQVPWRWRACCLEQKLCMDQDVYIGKILGFSWFVQKWRTSSGHPGHPKMIQNCNSRFNHLNRENMGNHAKTLTNNWIWGVSRVQKKTDLRMPQVHSGLQHKHWKILKYTKVTTNIFDWGF